MKNQLLMKIQENFPLCKQPFLELGKMLNTSEANIIKNILELKDEKIIRQISGIFDTKKLNYKSSLVAFKVEKNEIEKVVDFINSHPGVSHNYERDHEFNIWFTIAIPQNAKIDLEDTIKYIASKTNTKEYLILPTIKMFKIAVKLDTSGKKELKENFKPKELKTLTLEQKHFDIIKLLQQDIELVSEPFLKIVNSLNISYDVFFHTVNELLESGVLRRFAGILNHRKAGFNSNAMVVWDINDDQTLHAGEIFANYSAVSHCYLRPRFKNWNYNIFTMIHAKSDDEIKSIIKSMQNEINFNSNCILHSIKEFKKTRIVYFSDNFKQWEQTNGIC